MAVVLETLLTIYRINLFGINKTHKKEKIFKNVMIKHILYLRRNCYIAYGSSGTMDWKYIFIL